MFKIAVLVAIFAVASASENGSPEPYAYQYATGTHGTSEQSDGSTVTGHYFVADPENGHQRRVDYVADRNGFRANVQSNHDQVAQQYAGYQHHYHPGQHQQHHHPGQHQHDHHFGQLQGLHQQHGSAVYKQQALNAQGVLPQVGYNQGVPAYGSQSNQNSFYGARYGYGVPSAGYGYSYSLQQPVYYQSGAYNTIPTAAAKPFSGSYSSSQRAVYNAPVAPQQQLAVPSQGVGPAYYASSVQGVPSYYGSSVQQPAEYSSSYYYSQSSNPVGVNEIVGSQGVSSSPVSSVSPAHGGLAHSPAPISDVAAIDAEPQKRKA